MKKLSDIIFDITFISAEEQLRNHYIFVISSKKVRRIFTVARPMKILGYEQAQFTPNQRIWYGYNGDLYSTASECYLIAPGVEIETLKLLYE